MVSAPSLTDKARAYLQRLCVEIPSRRTGSAGNREATDLFADVVRSYGFATASPVFECTDWTQAGVDLQAGGDAFEAFASPYSLGCRVTATLAAVSTIEELEAATVSGKILLLSGDLTKEQMMPKNFPFYNPEEHQRIIRALEQQGPAAIIAATTRDPEMMGGGIYPFPLFVDGDFDIPAVYMTAEEGSRLAAHVGEPVALESRATRIPATGCNVIASKGSPERRVVIFAHIDAWLGTPGAGDNASGAIVLLLLAELLAGYEGGLGIELVAMNGEDYYSNPGEQQWLAQNAGRFAEILLGINIDDVGYIKGKVGYSLYNCPAELAAVIGRTFSAYDGIVEGEPWYQGDHGLFLLNEIPALALTSDQLAELMGSITHTPNDTPEMVDLARLAEVALRAPRSAVAPGPADCQRSVAWPHGSRPPALRSHSCAAGCRRCGAGLFRAPRPAGRGSGAGFRAVGAARAAAAPAQAAGGRLVALSRRQPGIDAGQQLRGAGDLPQPGHPGRDVRLRPQPPRAAGSRRVPLLLPDARRATSAASWATNTCPTTTPRSWSC